MSGVKLKGKLFPDSAAVYIYISATMLKKILTIFASAAILEVSLIGAAEAAILSFSPSGISSVSQQTDLYFDPLSNSTSRSDIGPYDIGLSSHGDWHFNSLLFGFLDGNGTGGLSLAAGTLIGPNGDYENGSSYTGTTNYGGGCTFSETCLYGFEFLVSGAAHYGWVSFTEGTDNTQSINGWAYEDVAGVAIAAGATAQEAVPEPASVLGIAFIGFLGISQSFKRKRLQKNGVLL